jgi:hypothetical protein
VPFAIPKEGAMGISWQLRVIAGVLLAVVAGIGCNPLTMPFFMMFGVDSKYEPEFRLATPDHEVTVLVLAYNAPGAQIDQVGIDRQLGTQLANQMKDRCKANKEKVKIVPVHKVEKFKSEHPGWKSMGAGEIGKYFEADYVIDLEVVSVSLYEPGSHKTLYRGNCKIDLSVLDLHKPYDGPVFKKALSTEYPKTKGPIPVADDNNTEKFRDLFVNRIATDICWLFTAHQSEEHYQCD